MNYLLVYLPEDYLKKMAEYFAAQRPPLPAPADSDLSKDVLAHGEALVTKGDAARSIPACSSCHGPHLTGMEPAIPGLLGLRAKYIRAQLNAVTRPSFPSTSTRCPTRTQTYRPCLEDAHRPPVTLTNVSCRRHRGVTEVTPYGLHDAR